MKKRDSKVNAQLLVNDILEEVEQDNALEGVEIVSKAKDLLKEFKNETYQFPIKVFNKDIQEVILNWHNAYKFPIDYYGLSVLTAASTVIGNNYLAEFMPNWVTSPIIYGIIVGNSGVGKSKTINQALAPIFKIQEEYKNEHSVALQNYQQELFELRNSKSKEEEPKEPNMKKIITSVATTESIYRIMMDNPRGILLNRQELLGWIKSMNQYSKGGDGEFWLEVHDNETILVDRVSKSLYIKRIFVNVLGGIQPKRITELANENRGENGFIPRLLFAYPDNLKKPYLSDDLPNLDIINNYHRIIKNIHNFPSRIKQVDEGSYGWHIESVHIKLSEDAKKEYRKFLRMNTDRQNNAQEDIIRSIYAKMDSYCLRFALILELLNKAAKQKKHPYSFEDMEKTQISKSTLKKAIELVDYFTAKSLKVIQRFENPANNLDDEKKAWYKALPESFTTNKAIESWEALGFKKRQVYNYLNKHELFVRRGKGLYEKRFLWFFYVTFPIKNFNNVNRYYKNGISLHFAYTSY